MKILHLTTHLGGGAARACLRLHHALADKGVESCVLALLGEGKPPDRIFSFQESCGKAQWASLQQWEKRKRYRQAWKIRLCAKPKELFSFPDSIWEIEKHPLVQQADIIHLHWVAGMIDVERFFKAIKKPIVWTLHDAWPFSGGFHYESYFNTQPFQKISNRNLEIKRKAYEGKNMTIVSPSGYLLELCQKSGVFEGKNFKVIPNSVPEKIYHPLENRKAIRKKFNVKDEEQLWFFACDELDYFRKGADLLVQAFHSCKSENAKLIMAGKREKQKIPTDKRMQSAGHIDDENNFAELLNASDAVIHTSREDNLPNILLESLFCGTPVLATPNGGIPEIITDGKNGWLTKDDSVEEIQKGFERIFKTSIDRKKTSEEAMLKYASDLQAEKFSALYRSL